MFLCRRKGYLQNALDKWNCRVLASRLHVTDDRDRNLKSEGLTQATPKVWFWLISLFFLLANQCLGAASLPKPPPHSVLSEWPQRAKFRLAKKLISRSKHLCEQYALEGNAMAPTNAGPDNGADWCLCWSLQLVACSPIFLSLVTNACQAGAKIASYRRNGWSLKWCVCPEIRYARELLHTLSVWKLSCAVWLLVESWEDKNSGLGVYFQWRFVKSTILVSTLRQQKTFCVYPCEKRM